MDRTEQPEPSPTGELTVGELARLAGVSVRTLHHYDEIGLLTPSGRTPAGYRLYSADDRQRLRQILVYRALQFSLEEIAAMLVDPDSDIDVHLRRQHRLVSARRDRDAQLLAAIEKEMEAREMGISLTPQEQFEVFGTDRIAADIAEAEQRWGETEAWRQSRRRTAGYTKADWITIKAEAEASYTALAAAMRAGEPADGEAAMDAAEAHRAQLNRWFYDCGPQLHRGLAQMYLADPRYLEAFEATQPGFACYVRDAIHANADRIQGE